MPPISRIPAPAPKISYTVVAEVQNLHIGGRKVAKGDTLEIPQAVAAHWLAEGVLEPAAAAPAAPAASAEPAER